MNQYLGSSHEERVDLVRRQRENDPTITNKMIAEAFAVDPHVDPYKLSMDDIDPSHPSYFMHGTHWKHFERLRKEDPVHYHDFSIAGPYWSVTRYDDIRQVDTGHKVFSSHSKYGGIALGGVPVTEATEAITLPMFIAEDQPKHTQQRKVVMPMFTPKSLGDLEPLIRERAGQILDDLPRNEEFNWVRHVSVELTGQMLATLFDIPQEDRAKLIYWSDLIASLGDPNEFDSIAEGFAQLFECAEYFRGHFEERKKQPPKFDLISMLAHNDATNEMDDREFLGNIMLLIVGGNDTTRNSISGGVLALNEHPDQYAKLKADPSVIPNMVSEIIRWQSPVMHMARTALEDTELGGKQIREGDRVVMWYISGNRDEDAIPRANEFLIERPDAHKHTAFGYGIHRCIGNRLADMQLTIIWEEIMKRFPHVEVTGEPQWQMSNFIHGIRDLPVTIKA